ncbi:hypothetical protein Kfla_1669 [Kribbella flavida DSM 17836]|uniref:Acyltransferase n=1 Tax=Kribbella flavida (strain DSM 17836 / JCM 10339 / NBRC 14399) TaxID=479435 RepID=D2PMM0_KRIFD|nr:acyltransferase domain-containing protein [Kribbella flavida]ADB30764.1 hypothetical protein Kfla_1669 [Kribbella flavida DSM 17836]
MPSPTTWLQLPAEDLPPIAAARPDPEALARACDVLRRAVGTSESLSWPDLPAQSPYFFVHVFLGVLPDIRAWHSAHRVPEDVSRATLSDLGAKLTAHRITHGTGGLDEQDWLVRHFSGTLYRLGRLQFERTQYAGQPVLDLHVPGDGPLDPTACDESLAAAKPFFARHFARQLTPDQAVCRSWLLDEQLAEYLPADCNIVRFQRRFTLEPAIDDADGDGDILQSVFGHRLPDLDSLPQVTRLQRAIVGHLREGRHWRLRIGRLQLPA